MAADVVRSSLPHLGASDSHRGWISSWGPDHRQDSFPPSFLYLAGVRGRWLLVSELIPTMAKETSYWRAPR